MMEDDVAVLRREFAAGEGSFLLKLRCELEWDRDAFSRLVGAMERCAVAHEGRQEIERWVVNGFWYLERFVPEWTSHPDFPRLDDQGYYQEACRRLSDLAYWLFFGESPYQGRGPLPPL
jgi:hypothetical protein